MNKNEILEAAFTDFINVAQNLSHHWQQQDHTGERFVTDYPFEKCFNEVVADIKKWSETSISSLQSATGIDTELQQWVALDQKGNIISTDEARNWYEGTLDRLMDKYDLVDDDGYLGKKLAAILETQIKAQAAHRNN